MQFLICIPNYSFVIQMINVCSFKSFLWGSLKQLQFPNSDVILIGKYTTI